MGQAIPPSKATCVPSSQSSLLISVACHQITGSTDEEIWDLGGLRMKPDSDPMRVELACFQIEEKGIEANLLRVIGVHHPNSLLLVEDFNRIDARGL